jgi:RNA polymerase sigma-70 factor (ECF subfamily)
LNQTLQEHLLKDSPDVSSGTSEDILFIKAIGEGDERAFSDLYQKYYRPVYNYLFSILRDGTGADDVLQEVFIAVWQSASKFQQKSTLKTWIYRIAYKRAMSWLRRHHKTSGSVNLDEVLFSGESPEEATISSIQEHQVHKAMAILSPTHRAVLELAFVQELSYIEIAEILDCPVGTIKSRMSYALRNLSRILTKMDIDHWFDATEEK